MADHFHYTPQQIAAIPPRLRRDILFHARNSQGLIPPTGAKSLALAEPKSYQEELAALEAVVRMAKAMGGANPAGVEEARAAIRKRWGVTDG